MYFQFNSCHVCNIVSSQLLILQFAYNLSVFHFPHFPFLLSILESMVHHVITTTHLHMCFNESSAPSLSQSPYFASKMPNLNDPKEHLNISLQNLTFWHIDYFELKAHKKPTDARKTL